MTWFLTEDRTQVRTITLNRPARKNAVPHDGWEQLRRAFEAFEHSEQRVLVIMGAGGAFCSGADLDPERADADVVASRRRMKSVGAAAMALYRLTKPTVAVVDGVAAGAGMNLALGCDVVLATPNARFSEVFVRRGLTLDFGGSWLLPRLVGLQRAKELALTGRMVEAEEAWALGLVLEVVEVADLAERLEKLISDLATGAPVAQMFAKQGLNRAFGVSFAQALDDEAQSQAICLGSEDAAEGVAAFLEKRPARFRGK